MDQDNNNKQKKLIDKLKSNFCVFPCTDQNYELVSYNVQHQHVTKFNKRDDGDNLETMLTPKLKKMPMTSRSRMPIYYKTTTIREQRNDTFELNSVMKKNSENYDDLASCTTTKIDTQGFHSTKLDENKIKSPSLSQYPYLIMTPDDDGSVDKASNTIVNKILTAKKKVQNIYYSPNVSHILPPKRLYASSMNSTETSNEDEQSNHTNQEDDLIDDQKYEIKLYEIGSIYSCYIPYSAKYDGDLSIKFAERLQIIKDDGADFILVKNVSSKAFGYVPRDFVLPVNDFLSNLV